MQIGVQKTNIFWESPNESNIQPWKVQSRVLQNHEESREDSVCLLVIELAYCVNNFITDTNMNKWN